MSAVGIGEMGSSFVEGLLDGGRTVVGWNRPKAKVEHLIARGMRWAPSAAEVARQSDCRPRLGRSHPANGRSTETTEKQAS